MSARQWWTDLGRGEGAGLARAALLQSVTGASGVALLATSAWLLATAAGHPSIAALGVAIVGVRFFGLARGVSRYAERLATHRATLNILGRLQAGLFRRLTPLGPAWLAGRGRGDVLATVVSDVESLDGVFVRVAVPVASSALVAVLVLGLLAWRAGMLAVAAGAGLAVAGLALPAVFARLGRRPGSRGVSQRAELADLLTDLVRGLADLLVFDGAARHVRRTLRASRDLGASSGASGRRAAAASALSAFVADMTAVGVLVVATDLVARGGLRGVEVGVVVLATTASFEGAQGLAAALQGLGGHLAAAGRIRAIVEATPAVVEPHRPVTPPAGVRVAVRELSFSYPGESARVLERVSFVLEPGRLVAIVGASGCGKSTVIALLTRHWDVEPGMIEIDGRDVRALSTDGTRRVFSVAAQPVGLLTGSLRENLAIARPDATDADLMQALEEVGLGPTIRRLPDRLDSWVGEQGEALSGGERQRLALARALLRPSPFLLLDEPAAHLDPAGEAEVLDLLDREKARRGILLASHNLAGLARADEIVVLREGRVVQRGRFGELAAADGWFRRMLTLQRDRVPVS